MNVETLAVRDLYTYYKTRLGEFVYAVSGVSFELQEGRVFGIAGESGCGKSTLALSLMGFYFPPLHFKSGSILIDGIDIMSIDYETLRKEFLGQKIAYIPQSAMNALNPTQKILAFVRDVVRAHHPEISDREIARMAKDRFEALHLTTRVLTSYPCELSGGMKQRTVIAVSTLLNPKLLIADEPTSALDVTSQKAVIKMLHQLMEDGVVKSMIFITHELPLLYHVADEIAVMYAGQFVELGTAEEIILNAVHPYSHALMGSIIVPEEGMKSHKLKAIPGVPPNLKKVIQGCRFADRCPYMDSTCRERNIEERRINGHIYRCRLEANILKEMYSHG